MRYKWVGCCRCSTQHRSVRSIEPANRSVWHHFAELALHFFPRFRANSVHNFSICHTRLYNQLDVINCNYLLISLARKKKKYTQFRRWHFCCKRNESVWRATRRFTYINITFQRLPFVATILSMVHHSKVGIVLPLVACSQTHTHTPDTT